MASREEMLRLNHIHVSSIEVPPEGQGSIRQCEMTSKDLHKQMLIYLQQSGLYLTIVVRGFKVYPTLIEALIERWRPKTHTFHFTSGEATITLEDAAYQLSVPINGDPVVKQNMYDPLALMYQVLGKWPPLNVMEGYRVRMTWLKSEFKVTRDSTKNEVIFASQAYLLKLIGGILLSDKYGNLAHTQYLQILDDFGNCRRTSWGSAILAFIYRKLCKAYIVE